MKPQTLIMLAVALGCGLTAMVMTQRFLVAPTAPIEDAVTVLVAAAEVQGGSNVVDAMVKDIQYPKALVPEGAITEREKLIGRSVKYHLSPNEIFTEDKIGVGTGLTAVIPAGKRGMTVPIETAKAVAGFIQANSHVDILLSVPNRGAGKPAMTKTILQDVQVAAVNRDLQNNGEIDSKGVVVEMVTFILSPNESEIVAQARDSGQLSLVLRSPVDLEVSKTPGASIDDVLAVKKATEEEKPPEIHKIDPTKVIGDSKGLVSSIGGLLDKIGKMQPPEPAKQPEPEPVEVVQTPPVAQPDPIPARKLKRLVYRDLEGNALMEVLVDAESRIADSLHELLEDVDPAEPAPPAIGEVGIKPAPMAAPTLAKSKANGGPKAPVKPAGSKKKPVATAPGAKGV